jgi:hypothetical protein
MLKVSEIRYFSKTGEAVLPVPKDRDGDVDSPLTRGFRRTPTNVLAGRAGPGQARMHGLEALLKEVSRSRAMTGTLSLD